MCGFAWTWGSMDIAWLCSTHGVPFHLRPMVSHGNTKGLYGNPMVSHGAQGHTHGVPWKIYGVRWKALGVPWKTQGTPWSIFVRVYYARLSHNFKHLLLNNIHCYYNIS